MQPPWTRDFSPTWEFYPMRTNTRLLWVLKMPIPPLPTKRRRGPRFGGENKNSFSCTFFRRLRRSPKIKYQANNVLITSANVPSTNGLRTSGRAPGRRQPDIDNVDAAAEAHASRLHGSHSGWIYIRSCFIYSPPKCGYIRICSRKLSRVRI